MNEAEKYHTLLFSSAILNRTVQVDLYFPPGIGNHGQIPLLLINDGQDLRTMDFAEIINKLYAAGEIFPLLCIGIHCAADRKNEYGVARYKDYKGRGARAGLFTSFVINELLPFLQHRYPDFSFTEKAYAGFSLGGLCALDIVWNHPQIFSAAGVFSGSLWWRDKDQDDPDFDERENLIMHRQVRKGSFNPELKFFFQAGIMDETADRNNNGIIDSVDDTLMLIDELRMKGHKDSDIKFLELNDGRHDVETWARAFPEFLKWKWGGK
jgi:enterochelin esterase-like enzyme